MTTPRPRGGGVAAAVLALAALPLTATPASAAPAAPGYQCLVGQVSGAVLLAQYCAPFGGAPANGVVNGAFTAAVDVLNGVPGVVGCAPTLGPSSISGLLSASQESLQLIGLRCRVL